MTVPSAYWRLILRDWYNANYEVSITIRGGVKFTGHIDNRMWQSGAQDNLVTLQTAVRKSEPTWSGMVTVRHDIDIEEIVAITATSNR